MVEVVWSDNAFRTFEQNNNYLLEEFSQAEVLAFEAAVTAKLLFLLDMPNSGRVVQPGSRIRRVIVHK